MPTTRLLLAIPAALLLAACGGSDAPTGPGDGVGAEGSFTGTVSGALSKSVTGDAVFGTSTSEGGFALVLGNETDGFIFGRELVGTLAVGSYAVYNFDDETTDEVPPTALAGVFGLTVGSSEYICGTSGGTVTISSSTGTRLKGSVNVTATCYDAVTAAEKAITLTGQFDSVGGTVD